MLLKPAMASQAPPNTGGGYGKGAVHFDTHKVGVWKGGLPRAVGGVGTQRIRVVPIGGPPERSY